MQPKYLALIAVSIVGYIVYSEHRISQIGDNVEQVASAVQDIRSDVKQTKKEVKQLKQAIVPGYGVKYTSRDAECLAKNIYHEAGVESHKGKLAVGQVTLNRVKTGRWGDSICDVVYAKAQFSWTLDPEKRKEKPKGELWDESKEAAREILHGRKLKYFEEAKFYHTDYIKTPFWADKKAKIMQVGQHIFYTKEKIKHEKKGVSI